MNKISNKEVAECVGLWLAEGDSKTIRELTFTNNSLDLILFFKEVISTIYKRKNKPRLYIYSTSERQLFTKLNGFKIIKFYIDKRANRPYYIYRLADTKFLKSWKKIVKLVISKRKYFADILRGIFAGEGNVKYDEKAHSRNIRIATKNRNVLIEKLLNSFRVKFKFDELHGQYWIGAEGIELLNKVDIAKLHPEKEAKFRRIINSVSEKHYSHGELKSLVLKELHKYKTTKQLSKLLERSELRILEVLRELKEEGKADWIKIKGNCYWTIKDKKERYLVNLKGRILTLLNHFSTYTDIAKTLDMERKRISKTINNYENEGLVRRYEGWWKLTEEGKKLILGVDESGSGIK